ncbi:MAG: GGDEF domain-containing protein, partial [Dehalococcoidia bacterium]|nr:GGDEF domain-containing protein [Dehalococcoidia bacterium]
LNLPTETVPVGLDHFRLFMRQFILEWRQDQSTREIKAAFARANQRVADYAMAVDLMANLTGMRTEAEVVAGILELFTMLFAPDSLVYFPVSGDQLGTPQAGQVSEEGIAAVQTWLVNDSEEYAWLPERNGFRLRLLYQAATIGLLEVAEVAFPNHRREYLNLAMAMARVCGMAVANARLFQQVQLSANTDSLTGLFNRRFFFQLSGTEWERAQRYGKLLSAIIFDIDHFKRVNDVYGHVAGDHVLTSIAGRCRGTLRSSDILGRYGGEEFIVLLPETNLSEAYELAERLRRTVAAVPFEPDGRALTLTISLGVATLDTSCASFDDLVCRCDEALYRAKAYGRNQTQTWEV